MRWPNYFKVNNNYPTPSSRGKVWKLVSVKYKGRKDEYALYEDENGKQTKLGNREFPLIRELIQELDSMPTRLDLEIEALKSMGYPYG